MKRQASQYRTRLAGEGIARKRKHASARNTVIVLLDAMADDTTQTPMDPHIEQEWLQTERQLALNKIKLKLNDILASIDHDDIALLAVAWLLNTVERLNDQTIRELHKQVVNMDVEKMILALALQQPKAANNATSIH